MLRFAIGFASGAATVLALVYFGVLTPYRVRQAARDPERGVAGVAGEVVHRVKREVRSLRTDAEAAAMVLAKTGEKAECRREGLTSRHVCRAPSGAVYRIVGDEVVRFSGDPKVFGPELADWIAGGGR